MEFIKCQINQEGCECKHKSNKEYGGYCKNHKDNFLIEDNLIQLNKFTNNIKDYKLKDLKYFYVTIIKEKHTKFKKQDYFNSIVKLYNKNTEYSNNIKDIILIQKYCRRYLVQRIIHNQGIAYYNRNICNNEEDFYSYEPKEDIESKYFFSYKDTSNYWCFDIRSLKKLIDMNYSNPYTIEEIPQTIKVKVLRFIKLLEKDNIEINLDNKVIADRKTQVKQKFVDLFAQIEYVGHSCDVKWILDLNSHKLKKLYRELEDIWNYRANLSIDVKKRIIPPDGKLFVMPVSDYCNCNVLIELQEILVNELTKIMKAPNPSDMNLGFMYFIIGLSIVSRPCFLVHHDWVQFTFG